MPWFADEFAGPPLGRAARQATLLLLVAIAPAALTGWLHPRRPAWPAAGGPIPEIAVVDAENLARTSPVVWADARGADAFAARHIPGAINVTEADWERSVADFVEAWRPGRPVIVYCASRSCATSRSVALRLRRDFKLTDVYVLQGGWEEWLRRQR